MATFLAMGNMSQIQLASLSVIRATGCLDQSIVHAYPTTVGQEKQLIVTSYIVRSYRIQRMVVSFYRVVKSTAQRAASSV